MNAPLVTPSIIIIDSSGWITALSTVVLVLVTAFYAYVTNKMFITQKEINDLYRRPCLGFEGLFVKTKKSATQPTLFDIQTGINLKNVGKVLLKYEVKKIIASINNQCLHNPIFINKGSLLFPTQGHRFDYDVLRSVTVVGNKCSGVLEYDIEYWFTSNAKYRTRKKVSFTIDVQAQGVEWKFLEEEEVLA